MSSIDDIVKKLRENRILRERVDYDAMSLNDVIALCQEGDQLAMEYLLKEYEPLLRKLSNKFFLDTQDEDDLFQVASIAFWDAVMKWNPESNREAGFVNHVKSFVNRRLIDEIRKDSTGKTLINTKAKSMDATIADDGEGGELTLGDTLASKDESPEEHYLGKSGAKELWDFLENKLSSAEYEVIRMYIKGYKVSDIAEETGMKYKSVENALMRVKNKLSDYLRTRESKKIRENKFIDFSEEEKTVLKSIITKIDKQRDLKESKVNKLRQQYEDYTEDQLEEELTEIEYAVDNIQNEISKRYYDEREDLIEDLEDLEVRLHAMESYLDEYQIEVYEEILSDIRKAKEAEYEGPEVRRDPYKERGLNRADFY